MGSHSMDLFFPTGRRQTGFGARHPASSNPVRRVIAAAGLVLLAACVSVPETADPASDAPERRTADPAAVKNAGSYQEALGLWRSAEDLNAWIGVRFDYDRARAMLLSETQRGNSGPIAIHRPERFFAAPRGVCVDLSRFAVETLRAIEPEAKPAYLMIEFVPLSINGNTLRRHWLATFERGGARYFFADSKRPGHLAGPYASTQAFVDEYATYRGREVVAFRELSTYERRSRASAAARGRDQRP